MLIKPFVFEPVRHLYKLIRDSEYRSWCVLDAKLRGAARLVECTINTHGWNLVIPDPPSFLSAYHEIFVNRIYEFTSETRRPRILDLGANVGVSVLFLKTLYPEARIIAYEPDPRIFCYLRQNVHGNGFTDVELINKAVWRESGSLTFHAEGADGGHIAAANARNTIEVEAVDIRDVMADGQFDFVKMDIEGAETEVVRACEGHLPGVRNIFVEYHSEVGEPQQLAVLLGVLTRAGFRLDVHNLAFNPRPFLPRDVTSRFDLQLNVFGKRT